jgi:hypothetical protein
LTSIVGHIGTPWQGRTRRSFFQKPADSNGHLYQVAANFHSPLHPWAMFSIGGYNLWTNLNDICILNINLSIITGS